MLAPRPITRDEVGCDEPAALSSELRRLTTLLADRHPGISHFSVLSNEQTSAGGTPPPLPPDRARNALLGALVADAAPPLPTTLVCAGSTRRARAPTSASSVCPKFR